ncbi:hypothetical protein SAMN04488242_0337 [Tessaracoccus oleiagri]|uniref:BadF-type ATPase n=2 Tax=Tessaracoccus oleiagri TaxID=686624 RepID=A0A1G9HJ57_9ACTN|nr:hypothetical protein SAMN04488242_0337 [Tessaracoccus oleiagri]
MVDLAIVDIGKSQTRWSAAGQIRTAPGADPARGGPLVDGLLLALEPVAHSIGPGAGTVVFVGSTALPERAAEVAELRHRLPELFGEATVYLAGDAVLAHAAAMGGPGVVASIGTGVAVSGFGHAERWVRLDGWGPDLGDRGGAFHLGRAALTSACRHLDGLEPAPDVLAAVEAHLGRTLDRAVANDFARSGGRTAEIAAIASSVVSSAGEGCRRLVDDAATMAADTCLAACTATGVARVSVLGRLGRAPGYLESLTSRLTAAGVEVLAPLSELLVIDARVLLSPAYLAESLEFGPAV